MSAAVRQPFFSLPAIFRRKNEASSSLRYQLTAFINQTASNGEFAESRLRAYRKMQQAVAHNSESPVKANGLKSVFYARFYAVFECANDPFYDGAEGIQDLRVFLDKHKPTEVYKRIVDAELAHTLTLSATDVRARDSYRETLHAYFKNEDALEKFNSFERHVFVQVKNIPAAKDLFNVVNRDTLPYAERLLTPDTVRLTKAKERVKTAMLKNKATIISTTTAATAAVSIVELLIRFVFA